jgi:hypothetical protein
MTLRLGDLAPDFEAQTTDGQRAVSDPSRDVGNDLGRDAQLTAPREDQRELSTAGGVTGGAQCGAGRGHRSRSRRLRSMSAKSRLNCAR